MRYWAEAATNPGHIRVDHNRNHLSELARGVGYPERHEQGGGKMKKALNLDQEHDFFSAKRLEDIVLLIFKENLLIFSKSWVNNDPK